MYVHVCKFIHLADHKYKKQSLFHLLLSTRQFLNKGVNTLKHYSRCNNCWPCVSQCQAQAYKRLKQKLLPDRSTSRWLWRTTDSLSDSRSDWGSAMQRCSWTLPLTQVLKSFLMGKPRQAKYYFCYVLIFPKWIENYIIDIYTGLNMVACKLVCMHACPCNGNMPGSCL